MSRETVLWKRLDCPGHDACVLERVEDGWRLSGTAVYLDPTGAAQLRYEAQCDEAWVSRGGSVSGWVGPRRIDLRVERASDGAWTLDGALMPRLEGLLDLDFGFTPATNLFALRRLALAVGDAADAPAAWFDPAPDAVVRLPQRYERRSESTYWYEAPTVGYEAELEVAPSGFTRVYPELWLME